MYLDQYVHEAVSNDVATSMITLFGRDSTDTGPVIDWVGAMEAHITTKRLTLVFFCAVIYDFIITIDQSINLFWLHRWSISKILFIINRANSTLLMADITLQNFYVNASPRYCNAAPWLEFVESSIMIAVFNMALLIRVYALWNRSPYVYYICVVVFVMHLGSYIGIVAYSNSRVLVYPSYAPFTGCLMIPGYSKTYVIFITSIVFESIVVTLTVIKAWPVARQRGVKTPLFSLLLEDGLMYYAFIILAQMIALIALFSYNYKFSGPVLGSYTPCAISGIACNRLLLRPQRLLVGTGTEMPSSFHSEDLRTIGTFSRKNKSSSGFTLSKDLPGERLELDDRRKNVNWNGTGSRLSKKRPSVVHIGAGVLTDQTHQPSSPSHQSGGSLDKEIDVAGHYLTGIIVEREDVQQVEGGRASVQGDPVPLPERGPFTYGTRRHILDSNAVTSETDGKTGNLTVSRIGRYD